MRARRILGWIALWLVAGVASASPWPAGCIQATSIGQTINASLATSDCYWNFVTTPQHRYYTDVYAFNATAGQQIAVTMASGAFDTYLELYDVNEFTATPLVANDDSGGTTNSRIPSGSGYYTIPADGTYYIWASSVDPDWTGAYTLTISTSGTPPPTGFPAEVTVTEFYHPTFNHYFITAYPEEAASLAAGNLPPWQPTGLTFKAWAAAGTNITNVCRFFSATFAPRSSHFYSGAAAECPSLGTKGVWTLESSNAFYMMPSAGTCPSGTMPLYRLYNNGMSGAPNHRYTNNPSVRTTMIAAGWIPEGNGPDGVFACIPQSTIVTPPPPPTGSAFQQEVTGYANKVLGIFTGQTVDLSQLEVILNSGLSALLSTGSTCPSATATPPLTNLTSLPPTLTINISYGNGCTVSSSGTQVTVAGSATITLTNLVLTDTSLAGNVTVNLNNLKINGVFVANGMVQASFNVTINSTTQAYTGQISLSFTSLQLPNNFGLSGTATINLNSTGTTSVSTNLTTSPDNVTIKLSATVAAQADGSVLVNTTGSGNTVGGYTVQATNIRIDADTCTSGPIGGTLSFTKDGQTGTLTFNSSCSYTYSGP